MADQRARLSVRRRFVLALSVAALVLAAACGGGDKKNDDGKQAGAASPAASAATQATAGSGGTTTPSPESSPTAAPTPQFPAPKEDAGIARILIGRAKVNAPVQVKGLNARNEMENPDGKDNVAWYDFTGRPGFGSNAVFSGHVDWYTGEQGVFWFLRDLKDGDEIVIKMSDGMELKYRVKENITYKADAAPVAEIVGPSTNEMITLITCDGSFDAKTQDYNNRRVIRAERFA